MFDITYKAKNHIKLAYLKKNLSQFIVTTVITDTTSHPYQNEQKAHKQSKKNKLPSCPGLPQTIVFLSESPKFSNFLSTPEVF